MKINRTKYSHDVLNILLYIIIATALSLLTCQSVAEGYIQVITIALNSVISGLITLIMVLIIKRFSKTPSYLELSFGLIQLIAFEIAFLFFREYSLFGFFNPDPINFHNGKFVMSFTSLLSISIVYGRSIWIKTKHASA